MTQAPDQTVEYEPVRPTRAAGGPVFWMLALMGVGAFAPCILLPEWREYQAAQVAQQREQHRLDQLKRTVEQTRRQLEAMQNDPTVVARMAERDLGFRRADEKAVQVPVASAVAVEEAEPPFVARPVLPPAWFSRATAWIPDLDYDAVFCDDRTRPIVMIMSVALIAAAVLLFHRRTPGPEETPPA